MVNDASKHNANGAKFKDWRLPNKEELNLMYVVYTGYNVADLNRYNHWSSSEHDSGFAWTQNFVSGQKYYVGKN